ncbi:hypothetical protein PoB_006280100 [Plakobranchus ocellatus]|uniref:Uncharacterized protein n=1 Tax=Plakobranchus ocellatus TaxID=259542 RepID=A0AAV4CWM1_9GAST|nr:hypothetical protein PoB_006280100 [Plakobranchus ocellatus]
MPKILAEKSQLAVESCLLIRIDNTVLLAEKAEINLRTPYLCGEVKTMGISIVIFDIIIGNVEGARGQAQTRGSGDTQTSGFKECFDALPELGGWGSRETLKALKLGDEQPGQQRLEVEELVRSFSSICSPHLIVNSARVRYRVDAHT